MCYSVRFAWGRGRRNLTSPHGSMYFLSKAYSVNITTSGVNNTQFSWFLVWSLIGRNWDGLLLWEYQSSWFKIRYVGDRFYLDFYSFWQTNSPAETGNLLWRCQLRTLSLVPTCRIGGLCVQLIDSNLAVLLFGLVRVGAGKKKSHVASRFRVFLVKRQAYVSSSVNITTSGVNNTQFSWFLV